MASPRNRLSQKLQQGATAAREASDDAVQWDFGQIKEVNEENSTVRIVMLYGPDGSVDIGWHPLRKGGSTLKDWQTRFGKLRKGMCCVVWYRGRSGNPRPGSTFIEIIGEGPECGGEAITKQTPEPNEKETGPFQLFSGGLLG